jgi:hypothetical protein
MIAPAGWRGPWWSFRRSRQSRPTNDQWVLAHQAVAKLTTDELHAIAAVHSCDAFWPGLIDACYKTGLDRPFALD